MGRHGLLPLALILSLHAHLLARDRHTSVNFFPHLQTGQSFEYQIRYNSERQIKTETLAFAPAPGNTGNIDITGLIRLEIVGVRAQGERAVIRARTIFRSLDTHISQRLPAVESPPDQIQREETGNNFVEFQILPDGRLDQLTGLDKLAPDQQEAWQEWLSRFLLAATFPAGQLHLQQKWTFTEPERAPSPIAGLQWSRESAYAGNQNCKPAEITVTGQTAPSGTGPQPCAVILTTAVLKQQSKQSNTTPEEFKLRDLRTSGTAAGKNRIVTYVSLQTGLLIRASEESSQHMDVTIAKTDGSNRVRYTVNATSRSEVLLIAQTALSR